MLYDKRSYQAKMLSIIKGQKARMGLTYNDLAGRSGFDKRTLQRKISDVGNMRLDEILRIFKVLDIELPLPEAK